VWRRRRRRRAAVHIHAYTLFFRNEKNHPGIVFFLLEIASRDQIYIFIHLTLRLFSTPQ
jgi:hypothetical protein